MDIEKLYEGMIIKNYGELCRLLGIEEKKGRSKKFQIKELRRYFEFHTNGHQIIIEQIYFEPVQKIDQRSMGNHRNHDDLTGIKFGSLEVLSVSDKPSFWLCECDCGNYATVAGKHLRLGKVRSCGCQAESKLAYELKKYYSVIYSAITEYAIVENPITGRYLRFDIYIPSHNVYIEVNGVQHYQFVETFHETLENFEYSQYKDQLKKDFAQNNGVFIEIDSRLFSSSVDAILYIESILRSIE